MPPLRELPESAMEVELGLKITQTKDDVTSYSNIRMAKDSSGPIFVSKETDTMFILIAHLKGFGKDQIGVKINEDGTKITICGERPVQEMEMSGWMMERKEVVLRGFNKVFRIPDGVVLDKIKARFNDEESNLKIYMTKLVKGVRGVQVEEVKETEMDKGQSEIAGTSSNQVPKVKADKGEIETSQIEAKESPSKEDICGTAISGKSEDQNIEKKETNDDHGGQKTEGTQQKIKSKAPEIAKTEEVHEVDDESQEEHQAKKATSQKVEPPAKTVTSREAATEETEKFKPEATIETHRKKLPELETQKIKKEDVLFAESNELSKSVQKVPSKQEDQVQERQTTEEIHQVEGEHRKESKDIEASKKLKGDCEPEKAETSHSAEEEIQGQMETINEIQEAAEHIKEKKTGVPEWAEVEKQKNVSKEQNEDKKSASEKPKMCSSLVIAGSAIIVTFVMLVINKTRTRKR